MCVTEAEISVGLIVSWKTNLCMLCLTPLRDIYDQYKLSGIPLNRTQWTDLLWLS